MEDSNIFFQANRQKKPVIFVLIMLAILAVVITVVVTLITTSKNHTPSMELVTEHSETPILKLYENLDPQTTIANLSQAATTLSPEMAIKLYQDGHGEVIMSDQTDIIRFYHNLGTEESEEELEEFDDDTIVQNTITEITDYPSTEIIYDIEYLFFIGEAGYAIYYNADDNCYEVSDMGEVYQFDTKEDAIGAFLAPIVKEQ